MSFVYIFLFADDKGNLLPDQISCLDNGVKYLTGSKGNKLQTIFNVESAQTCREYCSENRECLYWTWVNKKNRKCNLKRAIKSSGFRKQKRKATSGTMLNGCRIDNGNNNNNNGQQNQNLDLTRYFFKKSRF